MKTWRKPAVRDWDPDREAPVFLSHEDLEAPPAGPPTRETLKAAVAIDLGVTALQRAERMPAGARELALEVHRERNSTLEKTEAHAAARRKAMKKANARNTLNRDTAARNKAQVQRAKRLGENQSEAATRRPPPCGEGRRRSRE